MRGRSYLTAKGENLVEERSLCEGVERRSGFVPNQEIVLPLHQTASERNPLPLFGGGKDQISTKAEHRPK